MNGTQNEFFKDKLKEIVSKNQINSNIDVDTLVQDSKNIAFVKKLSGRFENSYKISNTQLDLNFDTKQGSFVEKH